MGNLGPAIADINRDNPACSIVSGLSGHSLVNDVEMIPLKTGLRELVGLGIGEADSWRTIR